MWRAIIYNTKKVINAVTLTHGDIHSYTCLHIMGRFAFVQWRPTLCILVSTASQYNWHYFQTDPCSTYKCFHLAQRLYIYIYIYLFLTLSYLSCAYIAIMLKKVLFHRHRIITFIMFTSFPTPVYSLSHFAYWIAWDWRGPCVSSWQQIHKIDSSAHHPMPMLY